MPQTVKEKAQELADLLNYLRSAKTDLFKRMDFWNEQRQDVGLH